MMASAAPELAMRTLGGTHLRLPPLGLGCAGLGGLHGHVPDAQAASAIDSAWRCGIRYFDTAPLYGRGLGEIRLGNALRARPRADFILSSKVGWLNQPLLPRSDGFGLPCRAVADYTYEGTIRSIEDTLNRTGLGSIDIAVIHDIDPYNHGQRHASMFREAMEGALPALNDLRRDGLIGAVGVGVNSVKVCRDCLAHADLDCFILAGRYTLLDQSADQGLLSECSNRKVGVIAAAPFNSGILAGRLGDGEARYDYGPADEVVLQRARNIARVCAGFEVDLMTAALKFPLLHQAVVSVLPGPKTAGQITSIMHAYSRRVPQGLWDALETAGLLHLPKDLAHA